MHGAGRGPLLGAAVLVACGYRAPEAMQHLRPVDRLVVDVALDNMSDNYSSKPHHVSPEFNNVMAAGAKESMPTG